MDQWKALDRIMTILASEEADTVTGDPNLRNDLDITDHFRVLTLRKLRTESYYLSTRNWDWTDTDYDNFTFRGYGFVNDDRHEVVVTYEKEGTSPNERYYFDIQITYQGNVQYQGQISTVTELIAFLDDRFPPLK